MGKITHHNHPKPFIYQFQQIVGLILLVMLLVTMPLLAFVALAFEGYLLLIGVPMLGLLMLPLFILLRATPPVSVEDSGILVRPKWGQPQFITWDAISEVRDYPLMPSEEHEVLRKNFIDGRKKYRAPRGKMLIVNGLPWPYRVTSLFAGADGQPVVALTNRTHENYDALISRVKKAIPQIIASGKQPESP